MLFLNTKLKIALFKTKAIIILVLFTNSIVAQDLIFSNSNYGFNVGANFAFGSHFQRFGMNFNFFYVNKNFQANSEARVYFNLKNLGPKKVYPELTLSQGILFGYGKKQFFFNPFLNSVSNQTGYSQSFAYSYNIYFNKVKTFQQTGIVAFQFDVISLILENDIFARPTLDRFRTGAALIQYQYKDQYQAGINITMWTGKMGFKTNIDTSKIHSHCYMDTTGGIYSNISHGLLSAQFKYNLGLSQNVQVNLGADAEQIRNAVQNRFIHDARFIPKKLKKRKVCHIPMLDENGNQYLYKPGQKIKSPKLFLNVFTNPNLFY